MIKQSELWVGEEQGLSLTLTSGRLLILSHSTLVSTLGLYDLNGKTTEWVLKKQLHGLS